MYYNFCRQHQGLNRITPAMAAGVTDRLWDIEDIFESWTKLRQSLGRAALITSERRMSETWDEAVLKVLKGRQVVMSLQEIYEGMENHPLVTPYHKQYEYGQPSYHNYIRSILAKLKKSGAVRHVSRSRYIAN